MNALVEKLPPKHIVPQLRFLQNPDPDRKIGILQKLYLIH